jgi:hypothetical protein
MQQMSFYCRSYCLLNMFRVPLCPSSGAREYYTSGCCLSYLVLGFQAVGIVCSCGCPKHVEQAIRSAIKTHLLHLVGILFPHIKSILISVCILFYKYQVNANKYMNPVLQTCSVSQNNVTTCSCAVIKYVLHPKFLALCVQQL